MAFQLSLADAETGHFLDGDGSWADEPDTHFTKKFETESEARKTAEKLLERFPFAECRIENLDEKTQEHLHHPKREQYFHEKHEWEAWDKLPTLMRVFARKPECHVYKPKKP